MQRWPAMAGNIKLVQFAPDLDDHRPGRVAAVVNLCDDVAVRILEGHRAVASTGLNVKHGAAPDLGGENLLIKQPEIGWDCLHYWIINVEMEENWTYIWNDEGCGKAKLLYIYIICTWQFS